MKAILNSLANFVRRRWRPIQIVLGVTILIIAVVKFRSDLRNAEETSVPWDLSWGWISAALAITWGMYALLVTGWRLVLNGWGEKLGWLQSARIWTLSSLAALLPGHVWAIAGMALMAEQAGVSAGAATGSAIVMQLLSMTTGATMGLLLVGPDLIDGMRGRFTGVVILASGSLIASVALCSPRLMAALSAALKRPGAFRPLAPTAMVMGLLVNAAAWAGYGAAFCWLLRGTIPSVQISWGMATGTYALAYLAGYLAVLFPGGLGVREIALVFLLQGEIGTAPAMAVAIASRLTTLVNQFGAAAPFLLSRRAPREHS